MTTNDNITMSQQNLTRYNILTQLIEKKITTPVASKQLQLSERQIRRLKQKIITNGAEGLTHGNKGKASNHAMKEIDKSKVTTLIQDKYTDFGPTFAAEKLQENHSITISKETLRILMIDAGLWKPKSRKGPVEYRRSRERKEHYGEMIQFDGSYHDWLEGRGNSPKYCLLLAVDDATGSITKAVFANGEGIADVFPFWMEYVRDFGAPQSLYIDRFSTYKINNPTVLQLGLKTQFEKAMAVLGTKCITAHSPQAKGRVERMNGTLQDRLVKELRLAGIDTVEEANVFLSEVFIPKFNKQFSVVARKRGDVHKALSESEIEMLPHIFSKKIIRKVNNDFTVMHNKIIYQLTKEQTVTVCKKDSVLVEDHLDGTIAILHEQRQRYLNFEEIPERPKKIRDVVLPANKKAYVPAKDHPWRKPLHLGKMAHRRTLRNY